MRDEIYDAKLFMNSNNYMSGNIYESCKKLLKTFNENNNN